MRRSGLPVFAAFLLCVLVGGASAQLKSNLTESVDPFSIRSGRQFVASGSGVNASPNAKVARITSDLVEVERIIRDNFVDSRSVSADAMTKAALEGALRSLDPHSNFYNAAEWQEMLDEEESSYTGIGASIANFTRDGVTDTYVLSTIEDSPAAKAGLKFGDKIIAINGEKTTGTPSDQVRDRIRGSLGSSIRITLERAADLRVQTIELHRRRVAQPSIPDAYVLRPGIGYIQLSDGFNFTTNDEFGIALHSLKQQNIKSLVLDLRGNGGGIVEQAVKVAERFLPAGSLILTQKGRSLLDNRVWRSAHASQETMPLVVLVDAETASASEIVAGALQDNDRALIVGQRTFGKGLVQSVLDLPFRTGLTLTTARYMTPSGRSLQRDYTQVDNYDYFEHKTPAAAIDKPMVAMRTLTDRTVFGGDGIQPDELVEADEAEAAAADALAAPLFFYVRDMLNSRTAGTFRTVAFAGDSDPIAGFLAYVKKHPAWKPSAGSILSRTELVRSRLRYEFTLAAGSALDAARVLINDDVQVAKAIEALPRSAELANNADRRRRSQKR